jgi:hypothetical protein
MAGVRDSYRLFVLKYEGKRSLGRPDKCGRM